MQRRRRLRRSKSMCHRQRHIERDIGRGREERKGEERERLGEVQNVSIHWGGDEIRVGMGKEVSMKVG